MRDQTKRNPNQQSIYIDLPLWDKVRREAEEYDTSISSFIVWLIEKHFRKTPVVDRPVRRTRRKTAA